ncbi:MAG: DUF4167 domain-containing protein [Pseudomonadota bacterium]
MRSAQKSNRARGRGNRKGNGNNVNRVYESAGPEGKVRGTPQQIIDKYLSLARDAQTSGDRVTSENFLQHAEHYQRILLLAMGPQQERREQPEGTADVGEDELEIAGSGQQPEVPQPPRHVNGSEDHGVATIDVEEQPTAATTPESMQSAAVGGLTTIDPAPPGEGDDLLVKTEDVANSQPKRRRSNGRAKAAAKDDTAVADTPQSLPE